jgi:hypothetical protein
MIQPPHQKIIMEELLEERSLCCGAFISENCCTDCQRFVEEPDQIELDIQEDY